MYTLLKSMDEVYAQDPKDLRSDAGEEAESSRDPTSRPIGSPEELALRLHRPTRTPTPTRRSTMSSRVPEAYIPRPIPVDLREADSHVAVCVIRIRVHCLQEGPPRADRGLKGQEED